MMKRTLVFPLVLGATAAFQIHPTSSSRSISSLRESTAEEHLRDLAAEWEEIGSRVKEFAKEPNKDKSKVKELTADVLKIAIDHARTQEELEKEHISQAHREFEKALQEENASAMTMPLVADSIEHWMEPFHVAWRIHEDGTLMRKQIYQYMTTDLDPLNDNFFDGMPRTMTLTEGDHQSRLLEASKKEVHAQEEETEASRSLEELRKNEELLIETLNEIEALQGKQEERATAYSRNIEQEEKIQGLLNGDEMP